MFRILGAGLVLFFLTSAAAGQAPKKTPVPVNALSMEVSALETLHQFKFTDAQLKQLVGWAKKTAEKPRRRQLARASQGFRDRLATLRDAYIDENEELITQYSEQLDELREVERPVIDDNITITEAARKHLPALMRMLKPAQLAAYIAANSDDIPDPCERLLELLERARTLKQAEWKEKRDEFADEIARLVAGIDSARGERVSNQVVGLLIEARNVKSTEDFTRQRPDLEKKARDIVGDINSVQVICHHVELALAELLSNSRLSAVLEARLKDS